MKKIIYLFLFTSLFCFSAKPGNVYKSKKSKISFFSSTPVEDISASSSESGSAINFENRKIFFKVEIKSFEFRNSLMQKHFNDNYMESDKYPFAQYSGVINKELDPSKDGVYETTTTGDLTIHGVTKKYTVPIKLTVKDGKVTGDCTFDVKVADHKIKVPKIVVKKIAESIEVKVHAEYYKI